MNDEIVEALKYGWDLGIDDDEDEDMENDEIIKLLSMLTDDSAALSAAMESALIYIGDRDRSRNMTVTEKYRACYAEYAQTSLNVLKKHRRTPKEIVGCDDNIGVCAKPSSHSPSLLWPLSQEIMPAICSPVSCPPMSAALIPRRSDNNGEGVSG